jgi:ABC-type enterochelin transport system substrate-binding protein
MAKLRMEILHEKRQRDGTSLRDRLFVNIDRLSALGSRFVSQANTAVSLPSAQIFAEKARADARTNARHSRRWSRRTKDVVVVEPSGAVMFQSDYLDLLSGTAVEAVAANTYGVCEYLDRFQLDKALSSNSSVSRRRRNSSTPAT